MLRQRVISAAVFLPILFVAIWFGDPWFSIVVAIAALLGAIEFYAMFTTERWQPLTCFGTIWVLFFISNAYYAHSYSSESTWILVTSSLIASAIIFSLLLVILQGSPREKILYNWAWILAGVFYVGWLLGHWILLMNSGEDYGWDGRDWVLLALFSTFAVDTTAYFTGRAFGRHKLAPAISPAKTWEGAVGGLVGAIAAVVILALILEEPLDIGYGKLVVIGFLVGVFAQLGDLAESKLKRIMGVKESGSLIPGHGGILDRLDSVVFTGVVVYYCLRWFIG
ncbi:MAG TPA: phosphatidate cytidylyltransferase [Dehalococcoidia bacterium]|nr:phosphatidate cytidylyltransferase [Dehalococcoidia bacterium]